MRVLFFIFLLLLAHDATAFEGGYHIVVDEDGRAAVFVGLNGSGSVDVPLPVDVSEPVVLNAVYVDSPDGVEVSLRLNEPVTIAYQTTTVATRTPYGWVLDLALGNRSYSAMVSIPSRATVKLTKPDAIVTDDGQSKDIVWVATDHIRVLYDYIPMPPPREPTTSYTMPPNRGATTASNIPVIAAVAVIAAAVYMLYMRRKT
jgi:hypothetical protein